MHEAAQDLDSYTVGGPAQLFLAGWPWASHLALCRCFWSHFCPHCNTSVGCTLEEGVHTHPVLHSNPEHSEFCPHKCDLFCQGFPLASRFPIEGEAFSFKISLYSHYVSFQSWESSQLNLHYTMAFIKWTSTRTGLPWFFSQTQAQQGLIFTWQERAHPENPEHYSCCLQLPGYVIKPQSHSEEHPVSDWIWSKDLDYKPISLHC